MRKEGELVLIHYEDKPALYARIEAIAFDVKKDWYQLTLLLLSIPSQVVTWILREEYIDGGTFTMGGHAMRLADVEGIPEEFEEEIHSSGKETKHKPAKIIPLKGQTRSNE
jgi:hypothetical protein